MWGESMDIQEEIFFIRSSLCSRRSWRTRLLRVPGTLDEYVPGMAIVDVPGVTGGGDEGALSMSPVGINL